MPNVNDWAVLVNYLTSKGYSYDGDLNHNYIAKAMASPFGWNASSNIGEIGNNPNTNNKSGFSALPTGYRSYYGDFQDIGIRTKWWFTDIANVGSGDILNSSSSYSLKGGYYTSNMGFPIRCLKDK